jgi:hypothetical protein
VGTYLRQGPFASPPTCVSGLPVGCIPDTPVYPNFGLLTDSVNAFDPNLKIGYVQSWSFGVQREIKKDNVVEFRYTANRGRDLWRQVDLNEINVVENGILSEFNLAQQNLLANIAAGRGSQFRYQGPGTGTVPLPITFAYFQGSAQANAGNCTTVATCNTLQSSGSWSSTNFTTALNPLAAQPLLYGFRLADSAFDSRRTPLGQACFGISGCTGLGLFPYNHIVLNQGKRGDPFLVNNSGKSWYDAFTVEFRRRFARGLLVQSSYTFGKSLSNTFASSSAVFDQPATQRNLNLKKGFTPFDIRHGFKTNFLYDMPFGRGKTFFSNANGIVDRIVGGWGLNGNVRIQSGIPFKFNAPNGQLTLAGNVQDISNVQIVGMTYKELQDAVGVYRDPDGFVYLLPKDIRDNTFKAFNVSFNTNAANGPLGPVYSQGTPTGRFIAPAGYGNCQQAVIGSCGYTNLVLHGPAFFRFDLALAKKIRFTETFNLEIRTEFLNAFNNINFQPGAAGNDINGLGNLSTTSFGRITSAYQDLSTTNDPGGRVGQIVVRINF